MVSVVQSVKNFLCYVWKVKIKIIKGVGGVLIAIPKAIFNNGTRCIITIVRGCYNYAIYVTSTWYRMFIDHPGVILTAVIVADILYIAFQKIKNKNKKKENEKPG